MAERCGEHHIGWCGPGGACPTALVNSSWRGPPFWRSGLRWLMFLAALCGAVAFIAAFVLILLRF